MSLSVLDLTKMFPGSLHWIIFPEFHPTYEYLFSIIKNVNEEVGMARFFFVVFKLQLLFISLYMNFYLFCSNIVSYRTKSEKSYAESNEGCFFNAKCSIGIGNLCLVKIKLFVITS